MKYVIRENNVESLRAHAFKFVRVPFYEREVLYVTMSFLSQLQSTEVRINDNNISF